MILKKGTVKQLQDYIAFKIEKRGFKDETLHERLLLLVEEVGDLSSRRGQITGMNCDVNRKITADVGEEIADVVNLIFAVGIKLGLDIENEFFQKEAVVDHRFYQRSKNV